MTPHQSLFPFPSTAVHIQREGDTIRLAVKESPAILSEDEARAVASRLFEIAVVPSDNDSEDRDWARISVQFLVFEAERQLDVDSDSTPKHAIVKCWIKDQTRINAVHIASGWIQNAGWLPIELLEQHPVTRESYSECDDLAYYEQAIVDDEVFVFEIEEE